MENNQSHIKSKSEPFVTTKKFFCLLAFNSPIPPSRNPVQVS